jgi:hypothetical protein
MAKQNNVVAVEQGVAAQATVAIPATLRALRVARVQVALYARRIAEKKQAYVARVQANNQRAYMLAAQQLAAQYGLDPAQNTLAVRAVHSKQQHAPSAAPGACARVHALAEQYKGVRADVLAACKLAGINPATAATQFAKWQKAQKAVVVVADTEE